MQFKVPQDVQREDTIVGPLTFMQLIICAVGGGLTYGIYTGFKKAEYSWPVWILPVLFTAAATIAIAFVKVHDMTFIRYLGSLLVYHFLPKKRVWVKGSGDIMVNMEEMKTNSTSSEEEKKREKQQTTMKKLDSLVKILDNNGTIHKPNA